MFWIMSLFHYNRFCFLTNLFRVNYTISQLRISNYISKFFSIFIRFIHISLMLYSHYFLNINIILIWFFFINVSNENLTLSNENLTSSNENSILSSFSFLSLSMSIDASIVKLKYNRVNLFDWSICDCVVSIDRFVLKFFDTSIFKFKHNCDDLFCW